MCKVNNTKGCSNCGRCGRSNAAAQPAAASAPPAPVFTTCRVQAALERKAAKANPPVTMPDDLWLNHVQAFEAGQ